MEYKSAIDRVVERYRQFWSFQQLYPPLITIDTPENIASTGGHDCNFWSNPDAFVQKHREFVEKRRLIPDDTIPMLRPPFSHAALPIMLGAEPELHNGSLWVNPILDDLATYKELSFSGNSDGWIKIERYYRRLLELSQGNFAIGLYEVPGPADLMGALRGFETILSDLYDSPHIVRDFALHTADIAVEFYERIHGLLDKQEMYNGYWLANAWVPKDTVYFSEHFSVNYSPKMYQSFLKPANDRLLRNYQYAMSYVYCSAGKHIIAEYFNRGRPVWIQSCDNDPPSNIIERFQGQVLVTIHTTASQFQDTYSRYGGVGVHYRVRCVSLKEAKELCSSLAQ